METEAGNSLGDTRGNLKLLLDQWSHVNLKFASCVRGCLI